MPYKVKLSKVQLDILRRLYNDFDNHIIVVRERTGYGLRSYYRFLNAPQDKVTLTPLKNLCDRQMLIVNANGACSITTKGKDFMYLVQKRDELNQELKQLEDDFKRRYAKQVKAQ
jgi:hypothetical protein